MASADREGSSYTRFGGRLTRQSFRERIFSSVHHEVNRTVYVDNNLLPTEEEVHAPVYADNVVVSSKYTLLTFLPKNLFEQFQRVANFYFLCVACIQFLIDTPVTPLTSILPLTFVIAVTAVKQGYEDWLRHKADNEVNMRPTLIIRNGVEVIARAMDIQVGDIVKVLRNEEFPCDLVMLSSEDPLGQCYVTTANLDGETNLKTFSCLNETRDYITPDELGRLRARITCIPPLADLYKFEGVMELAADTDSKPLGSENLLLRGARLKNTEYINACAVYTGKDTKLTLNSKSKKIKFSRVERKMNTFLIVFLILLLVESVISTGLMYWFEEKYGVPWYVSHDRTKAEALKAIETSLAFMVLYNYVIPISLYVTVEFQKFLGSLFFGFDNGMFDPTINERALANTSDLNEELGQIEYLFTDKTGTLTENSMIFKKCCIGLRQFEIIDDRFCAKGNDDDSIDLASNVHFTEDMDAFFKVLVLCHAVRLDHQGQHSVESARVYSPSGNEYEYHSSSPDEKALVTACCRLGIVYHGTNDNILEVSFHGKMKRFTLLHTLPFDPTRKRMSVIIQDENGEYFLLCKGAEVAILDRVVNGNVEETQHIINEYAMLGLRTLTIAQRKLSPDEYMEYDDMLTQAKRSLTARDEMLADVYNEVEQKLTLLGATAVEDKLQDQVPQTIEALRIAGIKVWVLTGDKEETAVNISHAAGHFSSDMHELRLTNITAAEYCEPQLKELMSQTNASGQSVEFALIIDGHSLAFAITSHKTMLRELCSKCVAVLCCRMSPIQKAQVVSMIKNSPDRPVTAAIGDGANDVSMIQEADVGLGIMGKEGRQAVRNSDYAFGKFKFVRRALLFHGHLYYNRVAVLVQYFFYKNVAWITAQVFYAIFSSFSQQSLFDPFYLMFYNLTFTSLPILIYGLFEQNIPRDELLNNPELYRRISRNATLKWLQFLKWNCLGLWHCAVFFFGIFLLQINGVSMFESGVTIGNCDFGTLVMFSCVITVNLKLLLETHYWCLPTLIAYIITFVGLIIFTAFYTNVFFPSSMVDHNDLYKALSQIYSTPVTWLVMLLLVITALIPDIIFKVIKNTSNHRRQRSHSNGRVETSHLKADTGVQASVETIEATREGSLEPISYKQSHLKADTEVQSSVETFELHSSTGRSSHSTTITGYDNPAVSLLDENLPSIGVTNGFTGHNIPRKSVIDRSNSSQKADITIEHSYGVTINSESAVSSSQIERVSKTKEMVDNSVVNTNQFSQASVDNQSVSDDSNFSAQVSEIPVSHTVPESHEQPYPFSHTVPGSLEHSYPFSHTVAENLKQSDDGHIHSPSYSGYFSDNEVISKSTFDGNTFNTANASTQPIDFVKHMIDNELYTTITTFSPSPSHTILNHQTPSIACGSVSENKNADTHFNAPEPPIL